MKHIDDVRLVATGSALRHTGRVHAPRTHAGVAPSPAWRRHRAKSRTETCRGGTRCSPPAADADAATIAAATAMPSAGNPAMTDALLAGAIAIRGARPSCFAASRTSGPRPPCRRPRGADRFLLFALP
ncbi:hypothetical protein [Burkholderia territorii]|uniref:hypothetical protein n=1 Tax=Burkholderia territorii TaxID=1503055 RepID=UPI001E3C7ACE|nr:hypothetical protein [Burkholderia territorii]